MNTERPRFAVDESQWVYDDITELASDGNVFDTLRNLIGGKIDPETIAAASDTFFESSRRDQFTNEPPLGGPYDRPHDKEFARLYDIIKNEVMSGQDIFPRQQMNTALLKGHACARVILDKSPLGERHKVTTYVFLTNPGERPGGYIAFSLIQESFGGRGDKRFIQGFGEHNLYKTENPWNVKIQRIVPVEIETS